jgi:hypothetical protein
MNWKTSYHDTEKVVELVYSGAVSRSELSTSAAAVLEIARSHGANRVLADCSDMHGGHSIADLYFLSDWLLEVRAIRIREAVVLPAEAASSELARFWETTCNNRGLRVRVFDHRETAQRWLSAQS